jgi:hypothetical protein
MSPVHPPPKPQNPELPQYLYRVHRTGAQTYYDFSHGFKAKFQKAILSHKMDTDRQARDHLTGRTNIASPFISAYADASRAEAVAKYFADKYQTNTSVVKINTQHLARGPIWRAIDILAGVTLNSMDHWLHEGEYLIFLKVPPEAIVSETFIHKRGLRREVVGA